MIENAFDDSTENGRMSIFVYSLSLQIMRNVRRCRSSLPRSPPKKLKYIRGNEKMKLRKLLTGFILASFASVALADLEPWTDYDIGEGVINVTTVKVDSNMIDKYLEGLSQTWAPANEVAKELGQIEAYWIHVSQLPNGGDFNVVLGVEFKDSAALQPEKAEYDRFMKKWGEANQAKSDAMVLTYPDIREIVGEYNMRVVTFK